MNPGNIHQRLKALADRKVKRELLVEDLRNGLYDGVINASEYFRRREEEVPAPDPPKPRPHRMESGLPPMVPLEGAGGRVLCRRLEFIPGGDHLYHLGIPCGPPSPGCISPAPIPTNHLHLLSPDIPAGEPVSLDQIAFLDTETTGLLGATGTVPFMVGVGWWECRDAGWVFILEQYLIEDFCHEGALFEHLVRRLSAFTVLCTYNGKSYDVPLLRARAVLQRIPPRVFRHRQLDLLHGARRIWKERLTSVSLKNVEARVLGIDRGPDIDGALIPDIFFHMARTGEVGRMGAVLDHNAQDILTLGALLARMSAIAADPLGCGHINHWAEFAAVARWMEARRSHDTASAAWIRAIDMCDGGPDAEMRLSLRLAALHKRRRRWDEAIAIWENLRTRPHPEAHICWVELAKYHEHVRRDSHTALALVRSCRTALDIADQLARHTGRIPLAKPDSLLQEMMRREQRLLRRVERTRK